MKKPHDSPVSLSEALKAAGDLTGCFIADGQARVSLGDLVACSALDGRGDELRGMSVLVMTTDQISAAFTLCELDGVASRLVLCPPDLPQEYLPSVIASAQVDAIVTDRTDFGSDFPAVRYVMPCGRELVPRAGEGSPAQRTEWILLTSGTSGPPKLVVHTLSSLSGAIQRGAAAGERVIWSTFYDIRRYGGLQIFLRAMLTGRSLVLKGQVEPTAAFLGRVGELGVTHISGTPSHWRRALMSSAASLIDPEYIRLSGEIADQTILNQLHSFFPNARIAHAFASTEAGVAFAVNDGAAGFPTSVLDQTADVEMKIENRTLWIRSTRNATCYLNGETQRAIRNAEGFVDTGDMIELRDDRFYFVGREDGVINVGGQKVHPEEVEGVINRHPEVEMSLVRTKKNSIMGALVVADVVLKAASESMERDSRKLQQEILQFCRETLSSYKVPSAVYFVPSLAIAESGKLVRRHA